MSKTKKQRAKLPEVKLLFPQLLSEGVLTDHVERAKGLLEKLLPEDFSDLPNHKASRWLSSNLPIIQWEPPGATPEGMSLYFLCSPTQEVKAEKVLIEIIRKWLIPEKEVHILSYENMYFYMEGFNAKLFFIAQVQVLVEDGRDLAAIQKHLPLLKNELSLSLSSTKYLEHVLDTKALSLDQKSAQIQQYLRKLTERTSGQFDIEIFREMSTFFALSDPDFRKVRQPKHLTRVVVSHYLMRKNILHHLSVSPEKRHLEFRFVRSKLYFPFGSKSVLGLSVAIALSNRYEAFDEQHILAAIQKFIPDSLIVKGSYYSYRANHDPIKYIYLELEKKDGTQYTQKEISFLKGELKEELKKRIEHLIPSVFMIRNEEEVMRNILLLSQELKYLSDLPQVMINFEKQVGDELFFTVIALRVLKKHDVPLKKLFGEEKKGFRFLPDRVQNVGYVRKKNPKEANVFHICIPKDYSILRANSSVNFYLARQKVISILIDALGEVRDYNGGMILKQGELLSQLKHAFTGAAQKNLELLENFFFALSPIEAQATTSINSLKTLFELLLKTIQEDLPKRESYAKNYSKKKENVFAVLKVKDKNFEKILNEELNKLENFSKALIRAQVSYQGTQLYGFIYETTNAAQKKHFQETIDQALQKWVSEITSLQELRLSYVDLPQSLDPRLGGDEVSSSVIKMLYEGLTRISRDSKPSLALAKSVTISSDQKCYTFKLRPSKWSDGSPLTAYDFAYAWKKILSPSFYTPFAYFFYPIKNAKAVKAGKIDLDQVGIQAVDDITLIVQLENPTPEFLEQTAHALYSPVHHKLDQLHPNWAQSGEEKYVCNGPMKFKRLRSNSGYELIKNENYWDVRGVKLDKITIMKNASKTVMEMYKNDELDWIGRPMRPWERYFSQGKNDVHHTKSLGLHWCVFNTQRYPFDCLKMRQAFFYAINREEICKKLNAKPLPAGTPLPLLLTNIKEKQDVRGDKVLAINLFEEALKEVGLTRKTFPVITLCFFGGSEFRTEVAQYLVEQWEAVLGISCRAEEYPFRILFEKMIKGDYHLGTISWNSWINNPMYTLGTFQYRTNRINFPKWEHPKYQELLDKAQKEVTLEKRLNYFKEAEMILLQECPILPINYDAYRYMHKKQLKNAFCSDSGNVDFRWASFDPK